MASRQSGLTKQSGKGRCGSAKGVTKNRGKKGIWKEARSIWGKNDKPDDYHDLERQHDKEMEEYLKK